MEKNIPSEHSYSEYPIKWANDPEYDIDAVEASRNESLDPFTGMTIKGKLRDMLVQKGMSNEQAVLVMNIALPQLQDLVKSYNVNWNDTHEAFPTEVYIAWMACINPIALKWIIKNKPEAWFRPMFEENV